MTIKEKTIRDLSLRNSNGTKVGGFPLRLPNPNTVKGFTCNTCGKFIITSLEALGVIHVDDQGYVRHDEVKG